MTSSDHTPLIPQQKTSARQSSSSSDTMLENNQKPTKTDANDNNNSSNNEDTKNSGLSPSVAWIATFFVLGINALISAATRLWIEFAIAFGVQYIVFVIYAWPQHSEKFYDFTGMITFLLITIYSFISYASQHPDDINVRNCILSAMVCVWTIRLGTFLFERIRHEGKDKRFNGIREDLAKFVMTWTFQGAWCFLVTLPVTIVNYQHNNKSIQASDIIGWIIWCLGFGCEYFADRQKKLFTLNPNNRGKFIDVGLWKYSRHPNYFGEIVLWIGIAISAATIANDYDWLLILSPLYTATLLIFVSGLPPTEKRADEKFKDDNGYQEYKKNTPILIPFFYCWK